MRKAIKYIDFTKLKLYMRQKSEGAIKWARCNINEQLVDAKLQIYKSYIILLQTKLDSLEILFIAGAGSTAYAFP